MIRGAGFHWATALCVIGSWAIPSGHTKMVECVDRVIASKRYPINGPASGDFSSFLKDDGHFQAIEELDSALPYRVAERVLALETLADRSRNPQAKNMVAGLRALINQKHREITSAYLEKYSKGVRRWVPAPIYRSRIRNVAVRKLMSDIVLPMERRVQDLILASERVAPSATFQQRWDTFATASRALDRVGDQGDLLTRFAAAFADRVVVLDAARKSASGYAMDGKRLKSMLEILALEVFDSGAQGLYGRALEQAIEHAAHRRGGIRYAHQDTGATREKYGHLRKFVFRGRPYDATPHLKYNGEPMIRIYFTYSREENRVLIYHVGPHLPSVSGD